MPKPSKLARLVERFDRRAAEHGERDYAKRDARAAWAARTAQVRARDRGCCRVCRLPTKPYGVGDPRQWGHTHHLVYRSAGGSDDVSNLLTLCGVCHDAEHQHRLSVTGTADALTINWRTETEAGADGPDGVR